MRRYSFSKVSTFLRCPRLFRLRYIDREEPERLSIALPLGSAFHDCIQWEVAERKRGTVRDAGEIHQVFRELLEARLSIHDGPVAGSAEEAIDAGLRMVEAYVRWGRLQDISTIEGEHHALVNDHIDLEGRVDFLRDGDVVELVELKTAARSWSQSQADLSLQAASYSLLTGVDQVRFVVVTKAKQPKVQELVTTCNATRLDLLRDTINEVDAAVQAGTFPRNISPMTCGGCEFRNRCLSPATAGVTRRDAKLCG